WLDRDAQQDPMGYGRAALLGRPGRDPVAQGLVSVRAGRQPEAAAMGDAARRLAQEQASLRVEDRDPPPARLAGQGPVIPLGVVAEKGEVEAVLAVGPAVTPPRVAPGPGQDRHDV